MADEGARQPELDAEWEALARFLAGESAPDERRRLEALIGASPERAALLERLDEALRVTQPPPLSADEVDSALAAVIARRGEGPRVLPLERRDQRPTAQLARIRWRWRHAGLRAAAAALVVAGGSMLWRATHGGGAAPAAATHYATLVGRVDTLRLGDGTRVILGPGSTLDLATAFGRGSREVTLVGDAFFDVVHDASAPFVVRTAHATLRDVGTAFSVHSDGPEEGTRIAVTSGAVDVSARGGGTSEMLRAGDRAVVGEARVAVERGGVSGEELAWTRGVLAFHDAALTEVAVGLRRWFGLELIVTDPVIATRRLTATFDRSSANEVGAVLSAALGGSARLSGDTLRIGAAAHAP